MPIINRIRDVAVAMSVAAAFGAAAQVSPVRYQLCEPDVPPSGTILSIQTNYRYPASVPRRHLQDFQTYRCEIAWSQSTDAFGAFDTCPWAIAGCLPDENGVCQARPGVWADYDILGARSLSGGFMDESRWGLNPDIKVHSGARGTEQWVRHRHWGWDDPARYAYMGVWERAFTSGVQGHPRCYGMAYVVGFFNGVWNTQRSAEQGLESLKAADFIGRERDGAPIKFRLFYNQTGCGRTDASCLEDIAEVFMQRSAELNRLLERRWEYFWELVSGQAQSSQSFTSLLRSRVINGGHALAQWFDALASAALAQASAAGARMLATPPTQADVVLHVDALIKYGQSGHRAVLVGHSQGNLFANSAYDGYLAYARQVGAAAGQDTGYVAAQVVHVAPASAVLKGPHVLAEIDLVIEALRRVDGTPIATNTLGSSDMPRSASDWSGHRLVDTYLDPQRRARQDIRLLITQALDAL